MMLAVRGRVEDIPRLQALGYVWDLKIDGVRCLAHVEHGKVTLTSRQGVTCTSQYPEIEEALRAALPDGVWDLDGEIAVNDERGLPSWPLTHKRNAQVRNTSGWAKKLPATYYVFDLLTHDGDDVRQWPLEKRQEMLGMEIALWEQSPHLQMVLHGRDGAAMWKVVETYGLEGLIAKRPTTPYREGRRSDWVKIKRTQTITCLVGGFDPGDGSRASTFGALHLYLVSEVGGRLVQVGKVGSGFSDKELAEVMQALHHADTTPVVVEVEYLDLSPDQQLRQPVFQRLRKDATVEDCSMNQLT